MKPTIVVFMLCILTGCASTPKSTYTISNDNVSAMREFTGAEVRMVGLSQSANFDAVCRLHGPIAPADGLSISEYITKAFNDEFRLAKLYNDDGITLKGDIKKIEFSSSLGYWELVVELNSANGRSITVENTFDFETSNFDSLAACTATAKALSGAIRNLIKTTIEHPEFRTLLFSHYAQKDGKASVH